jgi:3-hydroxymyristoyl/3-hydroxydecanoyl-(acyl carrier protein) dehydratase
MTGGTSVAPGGPSAAPSVSSPAPGPRTFAAPLRAVDRIEVHRDRPEWRFALYKTVNPEDPYMAGHFPGLTLLPAVFVLEGLRQAVTALAGADEPLNLLEVRSGRWLAPMQGGDEIRLDVTAAPDGPGRWKVTADGTRQDGTPVAAVKVTLGDRDAVLAAAPPAGEAPPEPAAGPGPDYTGILDLLPVRHPMLLVDRVEGLDPGRRITVAKAVSGSEPCYQGLPDGLPLSRYMYPRSLMLESFGQASVLLWLSTGTAEGVPVAAAFRDCRFFGEVRPGAVLRHESRIDRLMADNVFVSGRTWDGDRCVMTVGALIGSSRPRARVDRTMAV